MNQTPIQKAIEEIKKTYEYKHDLGLSPSGLMQILNKLLPYEEEVIKSFAFSTVMKGLSCEEVDEEHQESIELNANITCCGLVSVILPCRHFKP